MVPEELLAQRKSKKENAQALALDSFYFPRITKGN